MKFYSLKYSELILTVDPKTFSVEGGFRVTKGMTGLYPQGLSLQFKNREFDTKSLRMDFGAEQRLIKILKRHPGYGVSFVSQDHNADEDENIDKKIQIENEKKELVNKAADTNHDKPVNAKK